MKLNYKIVVIGLLFAFPSYSQISLKIDPNPAEVVVGESIQLNIKGVDSGGNAKEGSLVQLFTLRDSGFVPSSGILGDTTGTITGKVPGTYRMVLFWLAKDRSGFAREYLNVTVTNKPIAKVGINNLPVEITEGSVIPLDIEVKDQAGFDVTDEAVQLSSSNESVAGVDEIYNFYAKEPGNATLTVMVGETTTKLDIKVVPNKVETIDLTSDSDIARTGDVVHFMAQTWDANKKEVPGSQISYSVNSASNLTTAGAGATINSSGAFVAEEPGVYTVVAYSGSRLAKKTVKIVKRDVQREIEVIGHGALTTKRTTDFWVWEGVDGKDYAVTGTLSAGGQAYFWDITNPTAIQMVDSIIVDARNVNDVKISEDGRICVISSEGASNRRNGITIIDVSNPRDTKILSRFTDGLTGGIHNLYIYDNHVYALSNGQRYDIINIEDPTQPKRVGRFEIDNPARSIHDVWVVDGIAYSSNWNDGLILVDVGNGVAGGSPSNPVEISRFRVEGDANHTAFPFKNKTTGQNIVIAGDEIFPVDFDLEDVILPRGYLHFIDYTDVNNPKEIARYKVPEAGSHNFWVEGDYLYIGYYNGGLRVVDISGELQGDLYKQGREVGFFLPLDKNGYHANNAMTWGAMPHKGHIYFSDLNSGLWSVKLKPVKPEETKIEIK